MKKRLALTAITLLAAGTLISSAAFAEEAIDIAVVSISTADGNNAKYIQGLEDASEKYGYSVTVLDANGSTDDANAAFSNFISRGADIIIDMVFPATSIATGLQAAMDANIPVIGWGSGMADGIWYCNGAGGPTAIDVAKKMCEDMGGEGELLALTYHEGNVARDREAELDKILADYPDINVTKQEIDIPGTVQQSMEHTNAWLASRPDDGTPYAIWGAWDDCAIGAISALKQMDRHDVLVYGHNGQADAIRAVQDGWLTATCWQSGYDEALAAVEAIHEILEQGDEYEKQEEVVPVVVIAADNVDAFIEEHPETVESAG